MDIYKLKVEEIDTISDVRKYYRMAGIELDVLNDDLLFGGVILTKEIKEKSTYLENLMYRLRVRMYELQDPTFTDGTIDLYTDKKYHFTICEHDKKEPIGVIEYIDTKNIIPGNISYEIYADYQGHHYALRALRIIGHELLDSGITSIVITATNNRNIPSMKTIEEFGGSLYRGFDKKEPGPIPYSCDLKKIYSK